MKRSSTIIGICGLISALFCLVSMYVFPGVVKGCTSKALILCGRSVIPSLFPYMVLTRILLYLTVKIKGKPSRKSPGKGMSSSAYAALFAGLLSGAPTGAVLAGQLYSQGTIEKQEAGKIAVFSSVASPAFCINFFGAETVGRRSVGFILYLALVTLNLLMFAASDIIFTDTSDDTPYKKFPADVKTDSVPGIIYDSCMTMLGICAYVTFFMCIGEVLYTVISYIFGENTLFKALLSGCAEMTSGVAATADLPLSERIMCSSRIIGFGGLSVMMQTASVCAKYGIGCGRIFVVKLVSALVIPLIMFVFTVIAECGFFSVGKCVILAIAVSAFAFLTYFVRKSPKKYKKSKVNL